MGAVAHDGDAESDIQQSVQGIDREGEEALLVIISGQGIARPECSDYNRLCPVGRLRYLRPIPHHISGFSCSGVLRNLYAGHRFS